MKKRAESEVRSVNEIRLLLEFLLQLNNLSRGLFLLCTTAGVNV